MKGVIVKVQVKANSSQEKLIELEKNCFVVFTGKPATKGLANKSVIEIMANHFKVAKSKIEIVKGHKSRFKILQIN